jgi:hypothetical protein
MCTPTLMSLLSRDWTLKTFKAYDLHVPKLREVLGREYDFLCEPLNIRVVGTHCSGHQ